MSRQVPKKNIFDLSKLAPFVNDTEVHGAAVNMPAKSLVDQEKLLADYYEIPEKEWENIKPGSYIKYMRSNGTMRKGGLLKNITPANDLEGNDTIKFDFSGSIGVKVTSWSVYKGSIKKIWRKNDGPIEKEYDLLFTDVQDLNDEVKRQKNTIENLNIEIQQMRSEQLRIMLMIKKFHPPRN